MIAYLVLLLAAFSRFVPHSLHGIGLNVTAVGGGLLFFGSRKSKWHAGAAAAVMALTDVYLTRVVYGLPFHVSQYLVTWVWYGGVALLASGLLREVSFARVTIAVLSSATSFFLLSNLVVWANGGMYARNAAGLAQCYWAALPFYGNDLVSTALTAGVLFGLPALAAQLTRALQAGAKQPVV